MANFENRNLKVPSKSLAPDMYNWHSLLKPVGYSEDVFKLRSVGKNGEEEAIPKCEFTIENVHYSLLLRLSNGEIAPIKSIEIWRADVCQEAEELGDIQEGVAHFLVTNLDNLADGNIAKITFISQNGLSFELTRKYDNKQSSHV